MELSAEEKNFVKITKIMLHAIPKHLRQYFVEQWNKTFPDQRWKSDGASGESLFMLLPDKVKNYYKAKENEIKSGNEQEWDSIILLFIMLYSRLSMTPCCTPKDQTKHPIQIRKELDLIRKTRSDFFAFSSTMSCPFPEYEKIVSSIKSISTNIFSNAAVTEIEEIRDSQVCRKLSDQQKKQLMEEKSQQELFEKLLKGKFCLLVHDFLQVFV